MSFFQRSFLIVGISVGALIWAAGCESTGVNFDQLSVNTQAAMDVLPADAQFVAMVDVKGFAVNPTFSIDRAITSLDGIQGEARAHIDDFLSTTGFDPAEDLESVYVSAREGNEAVVVANVRYDMSRAVEFLDSNATNVTKSLYREMTTYVSDNEEHGAIGLAGESMLVAASSLVDLHAALDRIADGTKGLSGNAALMSLVRKVSVGEAWFVANEVPMPPSGEMNDEFKALSSVDKVAVAVEIGPDGVETTTYLLPRADTSSDDLADLVKGLVAVLKLNAQDDADAFAVLDNVDVKSGNNEVRVNVRFDNELFDRLVD